VNPRGTLAYVALWTLRNNVPLVLVSCWWARPQLIAGLRAIMPSWLLTIMCVEVHLANGKVVQDAVTHCALSAQPRCVLPQPHPQSCSVHTPQYRAPGVACNSGVGCGVVSS
jgi:hypothetical protein